jgi:hypothetical protein
MSILVQIHHILPTSVYEAFRADIARWTNNAYNNNSAYNLTLASATPTGASTSAAPQQNGSHPWLNNAWIAALTDLTARNSGGMNSGA